ncbi:hypothetical protein ACA910_007902 [Epithemia clementina (nom. ined.)]
MSLNLLRCLGRYGKHRLVSGAAVATKDVLVNVSLVGESRRSIFPCHNHQQIRCFIPSGKSFSPVAADAYDGSDGSVDDSDEFLSIQNPRWVQAGLSPEIIDLLNRRGFTTFTPVQGEAFEPILQGRDVMGRSRTGTGKTLAFGLPSITRLVNITLQKGTRSEVGRMKMGRKPSMVVLCPTRELARQVSDEISAFAKLLRLSVAVFHGGVSYNPQMDALRDGIDVLVGTPGRLMDHIESGNLDLSECNIAVLDEADEMLNMGFSQQVEQILRKMGTSNNEKTQILMFSATTPDWVKKVGRQYQRDAYSIDATGDAGGARVATTVRHVAVRVPFGGEDVYSMLENIIRLHLAKHHEDLDKDDSSSSKKNVNGKTIIFTNTKREADALVMSGVFQTLSAASLHGDHSQLQRDTTLDRFRRGSFNVLVATDVAARGIDIKDVDLVVQLGPPQSTDTYVHRSGRTGRAGQSGVSLVIFNDSEKRDLVFIERELGHDFKFEVTTPPSGSDLMALAAEATLKKLKAVPAESIAQFKETAEDMLSESKDHVELVARCLAAMNNRQSPQLRQISSQGNTSNGRGSDRRSGNIYESKGYERGSDRRPWNFKSGGYNRNNMNDRNAHSKGRSFNGRYNSNSASFVV